MGLRLGFHYHVPALPEADGRIRAPGYLGRFLDAVAERCGQLVVFAHEAHAPTPELDYEVRAGNVRWVRLGSTCSVPRRTLQIPRFARVLAAFSNQIDALLLRAPTPLLPVFASVFRQTPTVLLIIGDQLRGVDDLPQPLWRRELIRLFWALNARAQRRLARRSLVFANNRTLLREYGALAPAAFPTRTSTLTREDFFPRPDTCVSSPIRLLYAGRYSVEKGLFEIIEALAGLVRDGLDVVLDMVGWAEPGSTVPDEIRALANDLRVADRVFDHGFQPVGEPLFRFYRRADIFVIASRSFEGFPRTVWEAMACSVPVVATKVGGMSEVLQDGVHALLVEPRSAPRLQEAIRCLIGSPEVRRRLIRAGRELARESTLEVQVEQMMRRIVSFAGARH